VAILLVIGRHLELHRPDGVVGVVAEGWYRVGWIGVDLFFVLSGFLIGGLLINESRAHGSVDIRRFLVRRGLKIYPAYFVFLAYLIFLPVVRAQLHGRSATAELGEQLSTSWPHLVFVQNYSDVDTAQHLWSIGVEEHFYLLLPFVVAALALRHSSKLIVIGLASVLVFLVIRVISVGTADPYSEHMTATHLRLDALLLGVALRAILEHYPEWFAGLRGWRLPLVVLGLACWAPNLVIAPESAWTRTVGLTLTLVGAAAFLVATYTTSAADLGRSRSKVEPVVLALCWVGVFSYAIYLWHVTAIGAINKITDRTVGAWLGTGQLGWSVSAAIICVGVLAVGVAAAYAVERPVLRIRDRIAPSRAASLPVVQEAPTETSPAAGTTD
jgi:peptidoglycan/LPS O-acetylase OafA/YrhL